MCFNSGDSDVSDKPRSGRPWTSVNSPQWRASWWAYQRELVDNHRGTVYRDKCQRQNNFANIEISQSLRLVRLTDDHPRIERPQKISISEPVEPFRV